MGRLADQVFDGVIFDMDGTLIDSTSAVMRSWTTWATEYGFAPRSCWSTTAFPPRSVVRAVLPEDQHAAAMDRINALELADLEDIVVLPGAAEALAALPGPRTPSRPPARCRWPRPGSGRPIWCRRRFW